MAELFPILAGVAALLGFVSAFLARSRSQKTQALLTDLALRFEATQKQNKQLEQQARQNLETTEKHKQKSSQYDRQVDELTQRVADREQDLLKAKEASAIQTQKLQLQNEHLHEQVKVITEQLAEAVRERKSLQADASRQSKELDEQQAKLIEQLRAQVRESQQAVQQAKREKQQVEAQLNKLRSESNAVNPEELKRVRQKLARLEQLYTSMRGLREMAEERNRNWETALRLFANHILGDKAQSLESGRALGPLVGTALEQIGATLVVETAAEAARAEREALAPEPSPIAPARSSANEPSLERSGEL